METSFFTLEAAVLMVAASIALIVLFRQTEADLSLGRLTRMMSRLGLDAGMLGSKDPGVRDAMKQTRARCARCPREDRCERWLAGEIGGDSGFCPNNKTFMALK